MLPAPPESLPASPERDFQLAVQHAGSGLEREVRAAPGSSYGLHFRDPLLRGSAHGRQG